MLATGWPNDSCIMACFQTRSIWPKPDSVSQNQIRSRLVLRSQIQAVCGRRHPKSKSGKLVVGQLHSARTGPSDSYTLTCFWIRCIWPKPSKSIQVKSRPVLHTIIQAFFGKTQPSHTWDVGSGICMIQLHAFWLCWP